MSDDERWTMNDGRRNTSSVVCGLSSVSLLATRHSLLSAQEKAHYLSLAGGASKADWVAGRLALKRAFLAYRGRPPLHFSDLTVGNLAGGRPYIVGHEELICSLGHSQGRAIAAASHRPVGVDIEIVRPRNQELLAYVATLGEIRLVQNRAETQAILATKLWTLKEAVLKGVGTGLGTSFRRARISGRHGPDTFVVEVEYPLMRQGWLAHTWRDGDFCFSIAVQGAAVQDDAHESAAGRHPPSYLPSAGDAGIARCA